MRWIEFVYKQYLKSLKEADNNIKINQKEIKLPEYVLENADNDDYIKLEVGNIYQIDDLYYAIADKDAYPYEVFICSPFWELATEEDLIAEGKERTWVVESIVRYVNKRYFDRSIFIDKISKDDILLMRDYIHKGKALPSDKVGFKTENKNAFQRLFKESEQRRSLFMMPFFMGNKIENQITLKPLKIKDLPMAADSFEPFASVEHIEIVENEKYITLLFDDEFAGCIAKVYLKDNLIYEGVLPKRLNIAVKLHPEQVKEILKVEFI